MPTQTVTVTLSSGDDNDEITIKGKNLRDDNGDRVDEDEQQIVTILDGGDLGDDDGDGEGATYVFANFGKTTDDDDQFLLDLSGFDDDFNIEVKSQDSEDCWRISGWDSYSVVDDIWTFQYTGTDGDPHTFILNAESTNGFGVVCVVVCFVQGANILTPTGERPIETLRPGDSLCCGDGQHRNIKWIGSRAVDTETLRTQRQLRPIMLQPGAIEENVPSRPLRLSPQHRVLLRDWRAELLFGENEVLVPAHSLTNDHSITPDHSLEAVEYYHILLEGHHTVFADGLECETLMPAELALTALDMAAREELFMIFPDLAADLSEFGPLCRRSLKSHETALLRASQPSAPRIEAIAAN